MIVKPLVATPQKQKTSNLVAKFSKTWYHCKPPVRGVCRKSEKLFKNLVTIFFENLFGKLVNIFGKLAHIFGELAHIFGELVHIFARKLVPRISKQVSKNFEAIMATGGLQ